MDWQVWIILAAAVAGFLVLRRLMLIRADAARDWLKKGAKIIDVRSEQEFQERHLPGAINVPLDRLGSEIAGVAPDKAQPLLLHCLSGGRSGIGKTMLRRMGYHKAYNLGSYGRAERILKARPEPAE
jgi:phage shock protein E